MHDAAQDALARFLAGCDPAAPAEAPAYVARPRPFAPWVGQVLRSAERAKFLVMGQTGVGKSTELARLADSLGAEFEVLRPPIDEILDLNMAGWHDILVATALACGSGAGKARLNTKVAPHSSRGGATALQVMRNSPSEVHKRVQKAQAQYWDLAIAALAGPSGRAPILAIDGLEKLSREAAHRLFVEERALLSRIPFRCVITAPLSLSFEPYFGDVEGDFLAVTRLRALAHERGHVGYMFLRDIAHKRGAHDVMVPGLHYAIAWSGGLPRQLLQLLAAAATQALLDGLVAIEYETLVRARRRVTERWQYQLEPGDFEALARPDEQRSTAQRARLLALGALIEYDAPDGGLLLKVNPLVSALVDERRARVA